MKAAIAGGHDLFGAFLEAADMTRHGENPHVVSGVLGCFLFCTEAVEQAGYLPVISIADLNAFLQQGHTGRLQACRQALEGENILLLARYVGAMNACITPHRDRISFNGRLPTVAALA